MSDEARKRWLSEPFTPDDPPTRTQNRDGLVGHGILTVYGWVLIAACAHDWIVGTFYRGVGDLVPIAFCLVINVWTTTAWVQFARWRQKRR
jgi:hypothetical protein